MDLERQLIGFMKKRHINKKICILEGIKVHSKHISGLKCLNGN